jgi:hypothetical protein
VSCAVFWENRVATVPRTYVVLGWKECSTRRVLVNSVMRNGVKILASEKLEKLYSKVFIENKIYTVKNVVFNFREMVHFLHVKPCFSSYEK